MNAIESIPPAGNPLGDFVAALSALLDEKPDEPRVLEEGGALLARLVGRDDWLPESCAVPHPVHYQQYLLHLDPAGRFSVVSFVWGPGQATPIHNHTVWGLIGMLRGAEEAQAYALDGTRPVEGGPPIRLEAGDVEAVSPAIGDVHRVRNAHTDRVSVSVHVYGGDIGSIRRSVFTEDGVEKPFVSGYANRPAGGAPATITTEAVRQALLARQEIALLDVREEDPFAQEHPLWAANLPLSRLELDAWRRIPRRDTPLAVYGSFAGEDLAPLAVARLQALGYTRVQRLEGGLEGWRAAGGELFRDVNVPSKAFGEWVEAACHTPSMAAEDVKALLDAQADVVVLDVRRFDEYQTMNIPGSTSVPGAELVLRARALAPDPATLIIVNCAGRTRSIIGAQSLVNAGIPNPVAALRNGTIGWLLAGQALEHGAARRASAADLPSAAAAARQVAKRAGVARISHAQLAALDMPGRTLYRLDVRTPEEYAAGHLPGFANAPGGQLVQETDHTVPVRGARIVLADDNGVRADMTASWLAQMGWQVDVLEPQDAAAHTETGTSVGPLPPLPDVANVAPATLARWLDENNTVLLDVAPGVHYVRAHVPGAWFVIRAQLQHALAALPPADRYVVTGASDALARLTAADLKALLAGAEKAASVWTMPGGSDAWVRAGLPPEAGETRLASPRTDRYRRPYEGTDAPREAMQGYLDWEFGLVAQLARDGTHHFRAISR